MGNQILASNASMHWCCPSVLIMGRIQHARQNNCEKSGLGLKLDDHCGFSSSGHVNENEEEGKEN